MIRRLVLRSGLRLADAVLALLPARLAYLLADALGAAWYGLAPARRGLVAENLRRVSAATGRPTDPRTVERLVRRAFREHARYYLELLRVARFSPERIEGMVEVEEWERWLAVLRRGCVIAAPHLGNFEPFGTFIASHGIRAIAPVEEIEPPELYEFLLSRRGTGRVSLVPLTRARRALIEALRRHEVVALIADRDLGGDGIAVEFFGHPTTIPTGPATLALLGDVPLLAAACWRRGPDRFGARGWSVEVARTGDRAADVARVTNAIVRRFEEAIGEAPEQWFGAFQPIWTDQRGIGRR